MHSLTAKLLGQREHAAIGRISTSAMCAYKEACRGGCVRRSEDSGCLIRSNLDSPFGITLHVSVYLSFLMEDDAELFRQRILNLMFNAIRGQRRG